MRPDPAAPTAPWSPPTDAARRWREDGWVLLPGLATPALPALHAAAERALGDRGHRRSGAAYAARNLLDEPEVAAWAAAQLPWVATLLAALDPAAAAAPAPAAPVTAISALLLGKPPGADWRLPPHQDLAVPMAARRDLPGWGPWSRKDGLDHVQPPPAQSRQRLALRLHLDPCGPGDGGLTVIPGSHRHGLLDDDAITALAAATPAVPIHATAGDVLVMHPWLLHASLPRAATAPGRRRILHLEYAGFALPPGLAWATPAASATGPASVGAP